MNILIGAVKIVIWTFLIFLCSSSAKSEVLHIVPTVKDPCPVERCLTISMFAALSSQFINTNTTLIFQPGNHILKTNMTINNLDIFSLKLNSSLLHGKIMAVIQCNKSKRIHLSRIDRVDITNLHFRGCGGNHVESVHQLVVTDSRFQGVKDHGGSALVLNGTTATIVGSQFASYNGSLLHPLNKYNAGGAILANNSNLTTFGSTFEGNIAMYGGSIFGSHYSNIMIVNCTFNGTFAPSKSITFGGSIYADSGVTLNVRLSTFYNYSATEMGGGVYTCIGSGSTTLNIVSSHFHMCSNGAVCAAVNSQCNSYTAHRTKVNATVSAKIIAGSFNHNAEVAKVVNMGDTNKCQPASLTITGSYFSHNTGGAVRASGTPSIQYTLNLTTSIFTHNTNKQFGGGAICARNGDVLIIGCNFLHNEAGQGGAIFYTNTQSDGRIDILECAYNSNKANHDGGAMFIKTRGTLNVDKSNFNSSQSNSNGGAIFYTQFDFPRETPSNIKHSIFMNNTVSIWGGGGGGVYLQRGNLNVIECSFHGNVAPWGGAILAYTYCMLTVISTNFTHNLASDGGAIMNKYLLGEFQEGLSQTIDVYISSSHFINNTANEKGGAIFSQTGNLDISNNYFINNSAETGAVLYLQGSTYTNISDIQAITNTAKLGLFYLYQITVTFSGNTTLRSNIGSLFAFNSQVNITETITIENGHTNHTTLTPSIEGGAITAFQSELNIFGTCLLQNNQAVNGGAIQATASKLNVHAHSSKLGIHHKLTPTVKVINNTVLDTGGGIYLYQSELNCLGNANIEISGNVAVNEGGGIYAISSNIIILHKSKEYSKFDANFNNNMWIIENAAKRGGGIYVELTTKIYILEYQPNFPNSNHTRDAMLFEANSALYGGALYVADETNADTCKSTSSIIYSVKTECFMQSLMLYTIGSGMPIDISAVRFHENHATISGSDLFGGLLDRCTVSPFAEIYHNFNVKDINGQSYFMNISTFDKQDKQQNLSISSYPVQVILCENGQPDYNYRQHSIEVRKGELFTIELVAIDQVNNLVKLASIRSVLNHSESDLDAHQVTNYSGSCKAISFYITTPHQSEQLTLYAEGPCKDAYRSALKVNVSFENCSCSTGFQPNKKNENTTCDCVCDQRLSPYITNCHYNNKTVERQGNYWITNISSHPINGSYNNNYYSIYPNCPYDYCVPRDVIVFINFTTANGTDAQCANGRSGLLCGTCKSGLSLSIGSTRCIQCSSNWPFTMAAIIVAAIIGGIVLVTLVLLLNITVAVGTMNGVIFYANIVAADTSTLLSSTTPRYAVVFISWLNLDIGIDSCFFPGMDTYWKALLQIAFPIYVIFLVVIFVLLSQLSDRFAQLIGRKNPVAALGTMILLSYTKLLQTVLLVGTPAFASMTYLDGSIATPWLPEASVKYFSGKHIILFVIAVVIIFVGITYTVLLTFWQCFVKWIKNPRLCNFMEQYQAPYTPRHRYWTGLLLLVRVTLYITISVGNVTNDPATNLLAIGLAMTLLMMHAQRSNPIYRRSPLEIIEMLCYMNLFALCLITFYLLKTESYKTALAWVSTISVTVTFFLLLVVTCYHVYNEVLIKIWNWFRMRGENAVHYNIQNDMPGTPQPEDEALLQAADMDRRNAMLSQRGENDNHSNAITY